MKMQIKLSISALILGMGALGCNAPATDPAAAAAAPTTITNVKSSGPNGSWVCGCGGDCTSTAGDGIPDTWKTIGIDENCDGEVDLDLSLLGANPKHRDVFVQVDSLAPRPDQSASFPFPQQAIDYVVAAFENAPVSNPDGTTGIHLHIIIGNTVPYSKVVALYPEMISNNCSGPDAQLLSDIKAQSVTLAQSKVFHYALIADMNTCDSDAHCASCPTPDGSTPAYNSTGVSILHGRDFIVSLKNLWDLGAYSGDLTTNAMYLQTIAGTFMHELGHNFGLRHGGGNEDFPGYKPNYISVMNYRYQYNIPHVDGLFHIDYSRQALNTLDETQLDETLGLGSNDPTLQFTFTNSQCIPRRANASGPVDWNGDGSIGVNGVSADLNPAEDPSRNCGDVTNEVMVGHEDWHVLDYGFYNQVTAPYVGGQY